MASEWVVVERCSSHPDKLWHHSRIIAKPWGRPFCKPRCGYDPSAQLISSKVLTCWHLKRWRGLRKEHSCQQTTYFQGKHQGPRLGWDFPTWHSHSPHEKLKVGTSWLSCALGQMPTHPPISDWMPNCMLKEPKSRNAPKRAH